MLEYLAIFGGILIMLIVIEEIKDIGFKVKTTEKEVISEQVVTYDEFFDYWILHGRMQRICNSFGA